MKTKILILLSVFSAFLVSCNKDMKWINPDDSKADKSEIGKICEEKNAECGQIEYEYLGKMRKVLCGECENGYECRKETNKCEKTDESGKTEQNDEDQTDNNPTDDSEVADDTEPIGDSEQIDDSESTDDKDSVNSNDEDQTDNNPVDDKDSGNSNDEDQTDNNPTDDKDSVNDNDEDSQKPDADNSDPIEINLPECSQTSGTPCHDSSIGLTWSTKSLNLMSWENAKVYCGGLSEGDFTDWRLPNIDELKTLITVPNGIPKTASCLVSEANNCLAETCWDSHCAENCFDNEDSNINCNEYDDGRFSKLGDTEWLWSSSFIQNLSNEPWLVLFLNGLVSGNVVGGVHNVRCVRGELNTRTESCSDKPKNTEWNDDGRNGKFTQISTESGWNPTSYASSYSTDSGACKYKCDSTHTWENNSCINQKTTSCPTKPDNTVWNDNGANGTYMQTWNSSSGWSSTYSSSYSEAAGICKYKCDSTHYWHNSECTSPCDYEPCDEVANSTKICTASAWNEYTCGCVSGYHWRGTELGCTDERLSLGNICTGQISCFNDFGDTISCPSSPDDDFYGQDRQYAKSAYCIPKSFTLKTVSGNNVVVDNNTGLVWEHSPSPVGYTWYDAPNYCADLNTSNYGGYNDWRLPKPQELLTIVNNDNPAIDTAYFTISTTFWSSASDIRDDRFAWVIYPEGQIDTPSGYKSGNNLVLCVRGNILQTVLSSTEVNGDTIVIDSKTGLNWQKIYVENKNWQQALYYCENLKYAGYSDWRLPNKNELASLTNYEKNNPASDFPDMPSDWFWSSSTYSTQDASFTNMGWTVNFSGGGVTNSDKSSYYYVRCVRSERINDPCENHTCGSVDHSSGICVPENALEYSCACEDGYFWDGTQCTSPCNPNPCNSLSNSNKVCTAINSTKYSCGCEGGYFWGGNQCIISPCDPNPCNSVSNSNKVCTPINSTKYSCGCVSGYHWWGIEKGCTNKKPLGNICTGQNKCYNNEEEITCPAASNAYFFGQDAQYTNKCTAQSFTAFTDVVVDNNTGLTWEKSPSEETYTWYNRDNHCNDLNTGEGFAGIKTWRVPNPLEFLTIVDNSTYNLATNSNFTNMPAENDTSLWTNSEYKVNTNYAYHFIPSHGWYWFNGTKTDPHKVLCVSGEEMKPAVSDDFITSPDGKIVIDSRTGLMWQKEYETNKTWRQALAYCQSLNAEGYGGYSTGWRLPNKNELASLINYEKSTPFSYFPDIPTVYFWSSSTYVGSLGSAWLVHFYDGLARSTYKTVDNPFYVLCVRNADDSGDTGADTGDTGDTGDITDTGEASSCVQIPNGDFSGTWTDGTPKGWTKGDHVDFAQVDLGEGNSAFRISHSNNSSNGYAAYSPEFTVPADAEVPAGIKFKMAINEPSLVSINLRWGTVNNYFTYNWDDTSKVFVNTAINQTQYSPVNFASSGMNETAIIFGSEMTAEAWRGKSFEIAIKYGYRFKDDGVNYTYYNFDITVDDFELVYFGGECNNVPARTVGWANTQWPTSVEGGVGIENTIYGRGWIEGLTDQTVNKSVALMGVKAQFGIKSQSSDNYQWYDAEVVEAYNSDLGYNDEYMYSYKFNEIGIFEYTFRFSADNGKTWTIAENYGTATISALTLGSIYTGQNKCYNNEEEITCPASSSADFFGQDA